ncbi:MAG TPA: hypothetical protein VFI68_01360, partial [Anaerolineales bacterium]|nr:hypothetical protein [Anaerolineales bacterium]
ENEPVHSDSKDSPSGGEVFLLQTVSSALKVTAIKQEVCMNTKSLFRSVLYILWFGHTRVKTGSIHPAILPHALFNFAGTVW